jgi:hypothetical protein
MFNEVDFKVHGFNGVETIVIWFSDRRRVFFHLVSRVMRAVVIPVLHLILGIAVKRIFGLAKVTTAKDSQLYLLRRYINNILLSRDRLKTAFSILGNHYEIVSVHFSYSLCWVAKAYGDSLDCVSCHGCICWSACVLARLRNRLS